MPTPEQLRSRLMKKLKELFQLDQPDLDFGFYRIMHAKAQQVSEFIDRDLLQTIEDALGHVDDARRAQLQAEYESAIELARSFGAPDPEQTEPVKKARAALNAAKDTISAEGEVYDHLYRFFERYYDDGDFISRRYYTRETSGRAAPFAIPYNGEEVKLHWANADQYYIKTTEYFSNYTFDLRQAREIIALRNKDQRPRLMADEDQAPLRVHFRVADATEGEHNNVKESDSSKRFFVIHGERPLELTQNSELVVNFEYRPDPQKSGQERTWQEKRNAEAVETILSGLAEMVTATTGLGEYLRCFKVPAPTESDPKRPLLARYINQYTGRNTRDYFIHKDLGAFLRRELDFYIKNEVMRLDDIENADAPAVETYLSKIKVLRQIAGKFIDFLAQLEDYQKKLWLKKKFVVETNYCITLDRIPEEFYPEIAANDAQRKEWVRVLSIDEIKPDLSKSDGYTTPLTVPFLVKNKDLPLDTSFFDDAFNSRLVASIDLVDERTDGLLIHSDNFQALNLLQTRYQQTAKCVYIDPPYNTDASAIAYKNDYKDSSWLSLVESRLALARSLQTRQGVICVAIDDTEFPNLASCLRTVYGQGNMLGVVVVRSNPSGRSTPKGIAEAHDYAVFAGNSELAQVGRVPRTEHQLARYSERDEQGPFEWVNFRKHGGVEASRSARPRMYYPLFASSAGKVRVPRMEWDNRAKSWVLTEDPAADEVVVWPNNGSKEERRWKWGVETVKDQPGDFCARPDQSTNIGVYVKARMKEEGMLPVTWWDKKEYSATEYGTNLLKNLFGRIADFSFPKALDLVKDCLRVAGASADALSLDFFAGSGTTGHAVMALNREDGGLRRYILVEMGDYFDTVLKPRIVKAAYSQSWKDGRPVSRNSGISHCFKYLSLESYEDTLNNLGFDGNVTVSQAVSADATLREDFTLHYLLDVETRGSQSLLNIDAFADPTAYILKVKKPGSDEYTMRNVDLLETFNYLIGLRVVHIAAPQSFSAVFKRDVDPELPEDQNTKLLLDGKIKQDVDGPWWFRKVEGWIPKDPSNPNNGQREKVLIVWRKLTGDLEKDNLMLDEWFRINRIKTGDFEFDTIYVNGSNNLPNLKLEQDTWKVRLTEEEFMKRMWDVETV